MDARALLEWLGREFREAGAPQPLCCCWPPWGLSSTQYCCLPSSWSAAQEWRVSRSQENANQSQDEILLHTYSVQFSCSVMSDSLQPRWLQHTRFPCPSPTPGACSNSCPSSQWCHPTISSSVVPFSSHLPSFPASGSFLVSQFFASGGQIIGVSASASILPMNIQDWFPLG